MSIKVETAKGYLVNGEFMVSTEAAAFLAFHLDSYAEDLATRAHDILRAENEARNIQGISPRSRLNAEDIRGAIKAASKGIRLEGQK